METISQQSLYCVVTQRIVGNFVRYPEHKEFLIKSDKPVEFSKLRRAVGEYVALKNQIDANLVSIYDTIKLIETKDRNRWYQLAESKGWCYEYIDGFIRQVFS